MYTRTPHGKIECAAYAKINLTLEVLGRRPDGYHEVRTVLQAIDLRDTLSVEAADGLTLTCDRKELEGEDNLALRAAQLLRGESGVSAGARLTLHKRIPIAAGLGGGSADAAAALRALDRLWGLEWPLERLASVAERLGSDVPFCLYGGTALGEGRGERLTPLPALPPCWVVLAAPATAVGAKTAAMYARLTSEDRSDGQATARLAQWLRAGATGEMPRPHNAFWRHAFDVFPGVADVWRAFMDAAAYRIHLSGAGPTLFVLSPDEAEARRVHGRLRAAGLDAEVCRTVGQVEPCREQDE